MKIRRVRVPLAVVLLILASCRSTGKKTEGVASLRRMNVVLITIDTLRADRLGCYGYREIDTSNLDRLAQKGVLFENAVAQAPLTAPSHASMMTGLYPTRHKVRDTGGFVLPSSYPTLATILQRNGWDTAAFVGAAVMKKRFGLNQGFTVYDDEMPNADPSQPSGEAAQRGAADTVDRAVRWLDGQSGKPFLLWVHLYDPHLPYSPPSPFREKYADRPYDGEVAYADQELGRLFDAITKKSPRENTIIAVLSDHGESFSEHGEYAHGVFLYDTTLRIPFLLAGPGVPVGFRVKHQARTIDLLPTLLDLLGGKAPGRARSQSDVDLQGPGSRNLLLFRKFVSEGELGLGRTSGCPNRALEIHPCAETRVVRPSPGPRGNHQCGRPLSDRSEATRRAVGRHRGQRRE
jgi:arylsulfatase A-like enzyme